MSARLRRARLGGLKVVEAAASGADIRITDVIAHPLSQTLPTADDHLVGRVFPRLHLPRRSAHGRGHHRCRRGVGALRAQGLCGVDRNRAEAAARRAEPHRHRRALAGHEARPVGPLRRHAVRGDRRRRHRLVGHSRQGRQHADLSPARRGRAQRGAGLRGFGELGRATLSWSGNSSATSRPASRASR